MNLLPGGRGGDEKLGNVLFLASIILLLFSLPATCAPKSCNVCHSTISQVFPNTVHGGASVDGVEVSCSSCHDSGLHGTPISDERSTEICKGCHNALTEHWQSSAHGMVGVGCISCHSVHSPSPGRELALLKKSEDRLCGSCHTLNKDLHSGILDPDSIERKSCVICHNPHGGDAGLLTAKLGGEKWDLNKKYTHYPVAQGRCNDCHSPHLVSFGKRMDEEDDWDDLEDLGEESKSGFEGSKQGLLKKAGSALCYECHSKQGEHFEETGHAKVQNIDLSGEQTPCLGCHLPHASDYSSLTKLDEDGLCIACHSGYTPHHFLSFGSVKQGKLKCAQCHEPHGMPGEKRLLVQKNICSMCHDK